jgi:hypothetical protein
MTTTPKCENKACNCPTEPGKKHCSNEESLRDTLPMQTPGMHRRYWPQDVEGFNRDSTVSLESPCDVQSISRE